MVQPIDEHRPLSTAYYSIWEFVNLVSSGRNQSELLTLEACHELRGLVEGSADEIDEAQCLT